MSKRNVQRGTEKSSTHEPEKTEVQEHASDSVSLGMEEHTMVQRQSTRSRGFSRLPSRLLCFW